MILNIHLRVAFHFPNTKNSQEEQINFFIFYLRKQKKYIVVPFTQCLLVLLLYGFCSSHVKGNYISLR